MKVQHVPVEYIHQTWPLVEGYLQAVFDKTPHTVDYTLEHLKAYLIQGSQVLLVVVDDKGVIHGAGTLQWVMFPGHRVAFLTTVGGRFIVSKENHDELTRWVQVHGGTKIQAGVRPSVARLLKQKAGYTPKYEIVEKVI